MKKRIVPFGGIVLLALLAGSLGAQELTKRQREIVEGIVDYAPWDCPDRWLYELGAGATRNTILRGAMVEAVSWIDFLALANGLDWSRAEARKTHTELLRRRPEIESGKVRQNIVFLVALTAPDALERLTPVFTDPQADPEDKADAGCALAALGHKAAAEWLVKEFKTTEIFVSRPVFDYNDYRREEADEKNRVSVRSYRFWEMIFRRPYFVRLQFLARSGIYRMTATSISDAERDARAAKLLPVFIAKWHGHPGSDDIAMRMLNYAIQKKDLKLSYIWAQRASLLPDQDCAEGAVNILRALADTQLSVRQIDEILASDDGKQNRAFLQYERFIKTARRDVAAALAYFDRIAAAEHASVFANARRRAAQVRPSGALRDGLLSSLSLKIMLGYPKRSLPLGTTEYKPDTAKSEESYLGLLTSREQVIIMKTRLNRTSSVPISASSLAAQYRTLLEFQNLVDMEKAAANPAEKADLRYRQAKMFYRGSRLLYPVWGREIMNAGYRLNAVRFDGEADARLESYVGETYALRRAYSIFASIKKDYPAYKGMDLVIFHMGHCYAKLMDYRPAKAVDVWPFPDKPPATSREEPLEYAHRRVGELFTELMEKHPDSPWAQQVERAAAYHKKRVELLKIKREKRERAEARAKAKKETPAAPNKKGAGPRMRRF